jgi:ABC-type methionine transport system permease subunit
MRRWKEGHMSWMWMITLVIALAIGVNLGVILMALIQGGTSEDQRRHLPDGGHP